MFPNYGAFLTFLIGLGPKLQVLWPLLQAWLQATTALIEAGKGLLPAGTAAPSPTPGALGLTAISVEDEGLEMQIASMVAGDIALFDGSILRKGWEVIKAHPELVSLLLKLAGVTL